MSNRLHIPKSDGRLREISEFLPSLKGKAYFGSRIFLAGFIASLLAFSGTYALCESRQIIKTDQVSRELVKQTSSYSYYDTAYDDAQNLKLAKDALDDRYSRNLHAISLAYLSRIWEYQPREQLKKISRQWEQQKAQVAEKLSGSPSPSEKARALARYDLFLSRTSENLPLKDMISLNQEIFDAYQAELNGYLEDARGFGIKISESNLEAKLNPQYYKKMSDAFLYMHQLHMLHASLESAIQSRNSGELPPNQPRAYWNLSEIQIPLFIQKIYRFTLGKPTETNSNS